MKKVAIIIGDITRSRGTERAATNLATILENSKKYKVTIISCYTLKNAQSYYQIPESIELVNLNLIKKSIIKRIFQYFTLYKKIKKTVLTKENDVVIGTTHAINIVLSFLPKKIKKIACEHMNFYACPIYSRIVRQFRYKKMDALVVLTERDKKNYSFFNEKYKYVIPNSLPFTSTEPSKLENKRIIAVGGLTSEKGFSNLINMSVELKKIIPDWKIDIYGSGELELELKNQINNNNVSDFIALKGTTKDIKKEYLNSSIFIMTSLFECFPMSILEAQTCGLPVVSFDCNYGPADIIDDGKSGFIIPVDDNKEFINKVVLLANNYEMRKQFGVEGIKNSKTYTPDAIYKKWDNLLEGLYENNI